MYQTCIIVGNLGADAELRYTPNGTAVCDFRMAVNERWNDREGQRQEKTTWFKVTLWARLAETLHQYLTKGKQVLVEGTIDASAYTAQDGTPRASLELRARNVTLLGSRGDVYPEGGSGGRQSSNDDESGGDWMNEPPSGGGRARPASSGPSGGRGMGGGKPPSDPDDIPF